MWLMNPRLYYLFGSALAVHRWSRVQQQTGTLNSQLIWLHFKMRKNIKYTAGSWWKGPYTETTITGEPDFNCVDGHYSGHSLNGEDKQHLFTINWNYLGHAGKIGSTLFSWIIWCYGEERTTPQLYSLHCLSLSFFIFVTQFINLAFQTGRNGWCKHSMFESCFMQTFLMLNADNNF